MSAYVDLAETYNSYAGTDIVVTAQLSNINDDDGISKKCYILGSLQTISISTHQDKRPVRSIGNINALDYVMGQRTIAGSLVFAVFDRHFADEIFEDLKAYTDKVVLLTDEIPPLDLTIIFANEYGKKSKMALYGVKIINEGQVMSINDLYTENTYQFVALGLDPLKAEDNEYIEPKKAKEKTKTYGKGNNIPFEKYNEKAYHPEHILDPSYYLNNKEKPTPEPNPNKKPPQVIINQPITKDGDGVINIKTNDDNINVYITDKKTNNTKLINKNIVDNNLYVELPEGEYDLQFYDVLINKYYPKENISIKFPKDDNERENYVLINYVTDNELFLELNNIYDDIILEDSDTKKREKINRFLQGNKLHLDNLQNDRLYTIYVFDNENNYIQKKIKTLLEKNEDLELFIEYVKYNKPLWINDFSDFNFDQLNNGGLTIIDKVLNLEDSSYKYELLIYAIKLQNEILNTFNDDININKIFNKDIININLETLDNFEKINVYNIKNNNEYYIYSSNNLDNNFIGLSNKRYDFQIINSDMSKGLKYNYSFLNNTYKVLFKKYSNFNSLSIDKSKQKYPYFSNDFLNVITAKDFIDSDFYVLLGPSYNYNEFLKVNVNYKEYLQNQDYFLCISSIYDSYNYSPIRKIKFTKIDEILILENYKTSILNNNYYLIWIENCNFEKISFSTIISTYKESSELDRYNLLNIKNYIDNLTLVLNRCLPYQDLFNSISFSILSSDVSFKNINYVFIQELINQNYTSLYYDNLDNILFECLKLMYNNITTLCDKVIIENNEILFVNPKNCKCVIIDFYIDYTLPVINDSNIFCVDISQKNNLYTIIYLRQNNIINISGFMLVNNITKKTYNYKLNVEVK